MNLLNINHHYRETGVKRGETETSWDNGVDVYSTSITGKMCAEDFQQSILDLGTIAEQLYRTLD